VPSRGHTSPRVLPAVVVEHRRSWEGAPGGRSGYAGAPGAQGEAWVSVTGRKALGIFKEIECRSVIHRLLSSYGSKF